MNAGVPTYETRLKNQIESITYEYTEKLNDVLSHPVGSGGQTLRDVMSAMDNYRNEAEYLLPHAGGVQ